MSSSDLAVPITNATQSRRSISDWVGAITFVAIAVWTLVTGWVPVISDSWFAGILLLPNWVSPLLNAIGFLRRKPMLAAHGGWAPRLVSHVVTFSLPIYFALMGKTLHVRATGLAFVFAIVVGIVAGVYMVWSAWALRNSWSIEPQARKLVTTGPFEFSRHPLYTSYVLRNVTALVLYLDFRLAGFLLFWTALLLYRIRCEERVLSECYPEYEQFRERVYMFSPRLP